MYLILVYVDLYSEHSKLHIHHRAVLKSQITKIISK
jgi:hypothetical protein